MREYTPQERKIHTSIYFLMDQSLDNPVLKVRILQSATQKILNEIDEIIDSLTEKLNDEGLRHDQFLLLDQCKETKDFLKILIVNRGFSQYRSFKQ